MDLAAEQGLFDSERKLQILIVGDTVGGLTLASLLRKRGFDPLVLRTGADWSPSKLTTLWDAAVRVLQKIGIEGQHLENMVALDDLFVLTKTDGDQLKKVDTNTKYPSPTVFSTAELRDTVHNQFSDDRIREKDITSLSNRGESVTAQFGDGVKESFDLVVDAGYRRLLDPAVGTDSEVTNTDLVQIELTTPIGYHRRGTLIEGWIDDVLMQQIPTPGNRETALLRMTSRKESIPVETMVTEWRRRTGANLSKQSERTPRSREMAIDWTITPGTTADASRWADGRHLFLSAAAIGLPPASGFHIGSAIGDAWVLADEIVHASGSPATVGTRFARRRQNRLIRIRNRAIAASSIHAYPVRDTEPFETVTAFRSVSLGSFCATELAELQEGSAFGS